MRSENIQKASEIITMIDAGIENYEKEIKLLEELRVFIVTFIKKEKEHDGGQKLLDSK